MVKIGSPMATGNGAYVIHSILEKKIPDYFLQGYNPYVTLAPPLLSLLKRRFQSADIIHTTPDYACFFTRPKIPLLITFHNYVLDTFMHQYSTLPQRIHYQTDLKLFTRKSLRLAHRITSVSHYTASLVKKDMNYNGNIQVIYNGIDTNVFTPVDKNNDSKIRVLFSGNLIRRKGAHLLTSIAKKIGKNIIIQYTKGLRTKNLLPNLPNLVNLGSIPYEQMPDIYRQADILLFPTVREGFGLAAAEAMACGLPVVATNCSSLPELIITGKGGFLCPLGDVDTFAEKINALAESPRLRKEMGEFNRERVEEKFTLQKMITEYQQLFESVLAKGIE